MTLFPIIALLAASTQAAPRGVSESAKGRDLRTMDRAEPAQLVPVETVGDVSQTLAVNDDRDGSAYPTQGEVWATILGDARDNRSLSKLGLGMSKVTALNQLSASSTRLPSEDAKITLPARQSLEKHIQAALVAFGVDRDVAAAREMALKHFDWTPRITSQIVNKLAPLPKKEKAPVASKGKRGFRFRSLAPERTREQKDADAAWFRAAAERARKAATKAGAQADRSLAAKSAEREAAGPSPEDQFQDDEEIRAIIGQGDRSLDAINREIDERNLRRDRKLTPLTPERLGQLLGERPSTREERELAFLNEYRHAAQKLGMTQQTLAVRLFTLQKIVDGAKGPQQADPLAVEALAKKVLYADLPFKLPSIAVVMHQAGEHSITPHFYNDAVRQWIGLAIALSERKEELPPADAGFKSAVLARAAKMLGIDKPQLWTLLLRNGGAVKERDLDYHVINQVFRISLWHANGDAQTLGMLELAASYPQPAQVLAQRMGITLTELERRLQAVIRDNPRAFRKGAVPAAAASPAPPIEKPAAARRRGRPGPKIAFLEPKRIPAGSMYDGDEPVFASFVATQLYWARALAGGWQGAKAALKLSYATFPRYLRIAGGKPIFDSAPPGSLPEIKPLLESIDGFVRELWTYYGGDRGAVEKKLSDMPRYNRSEALNKIARSSPQPR